MPEPEFCDRDVSCDQRLVSPVDVAGDEDEISSGAHPVLFAEGVAADKLQSGVGAGRADLDPPAGGSYVAISSFLEAELADLEVE